MIKKSVVVFYIFAGIVFLYSCNGNQQKAANEVTEIAFNVDTSLLKSDPVLLEDLDFSMRVPRNWKPVDNKIKERLTSEILEGNYSNARLIDIMGNLSDNSVLILMDVSKVNQDYFADLRLNHQEIFCSDSLWKNSRYESFYHNGLSIDQYFLQNENMVQFRLICKPATEESGKSMVDVYYILSRDRLSENIKFIESSIGTFTCITNKNQNQ